MKNHPTGSLHRTVDGHQGVVSKERCPGCGCLSVLYYKPRRKLVKECLNCGPLELVRLLMTG